MLDIVSTSASALRFTQLVERSGLPKSSAHRILAILVGQRLVYLDKGTRTYRPGPRLVDWGERATARPAFDRAVVHYQP